MNYIYDIYLNLNEKLYDFFEWNRSDKIIHIKKIPIFRLSEEDLKKCINHSIKVDSDFIKNVNEKTEYLGYQKLSNPIVLFASTNDIVAIQFNKNGNSIKKSHLFIDEELEILEIVNNMKIQNVNFELIHKVKNILKTRKELNEKAFINEELKNIDSAKLDYIYFECFGLKEKSKEKKLSMIRNIKENTKIYKKLYNILKLTSTSNK